mgnify:CR=1 FL=1
MFWHLRCRAYILVTHRLNQTSTGWLKIFNYFVQTVLVIVGPVHAAFGWLSVFNLQVLLLRDFAVPQTWFGVRAGARFVGRPLRDAANAVSARGTGHFCATCLRRRTLADDAVPLDRQRRAQPGFRPPSLLAKVQIVASCTVWFVMSAALCSFVALWIFRFVCSVHGC